MKKVKINASKNYEVIIGPELIDRAGEMISKVRSYSSVFIVSDSNVFGLYGDRIIKNIQKSDLKTSSFVFAAKEESKNIDTYGELLEKMCDSHLTRSDVVIALGGGVTGDLAGFAAATYQRGIDFVQIPTTLLAAVDASVGGKTAIDHCGKKNQVGSFHQPSLVICDTKTLQTLPKIEYINGCAEVIKYAMITSSEFFDLLECTPVCDKYEEVIESCVKYKRDFVEQDEFDTGKRMMLNFGHTLGHAVEACSDYSISHGQAVAMGMIAITKIACAKGLCEKETLERLTSLIVSYELPTKIPYKSDELIDAILSDKKMSGDELRVVMPREIGKCEIRTVSVDELKNLIADI